MIKSEKVAVALLVLTGAAVATSASAGAAIAPDRWMFEAGMSGAREVPGPGDRNGSGFARITIDTETGEICWDLTVRNVDGEIFGAHIHDGERDEAGPVVQPLTAPADGDSTGCATNSELAGQIVADPSAFYVNVHSSPDFPGGAVRGQLAGPHD